MAEFRIPAESESIVESKSFKLSLNSMNNTRFDDLASVKETVEQDISSAARARVSMDLLTRPRFSVQTTEMEGDCIDEFDVETKDYDVQPAHLSVSGPCDRNPLFLPA